MRFIYYKPQTRPIRQGQGSCRKASSRHLGCTSCCGVQWLVQPAPKSMLWLSTSLQSSPKPTICHGVVNRLCSFGLGQRKNHLSELTWLVRNQESLQVADRQIYTWSIPCWKSLRSVLSRCCPRPKWRKWFWLSSSPERGADPPILNKGWLQIRIRLLKGWM